MQSRRNVYQEGGYFFLRALSAEEQHGFVFRGQFPAHEPVHLVLQPGKLMAKFLQPGKGNCAETAGFKRNSGTDMLLFIDGVQPQQFAGEIKSQDLLISVFSRPVCLDRPRPYGVDLLKLVSGMVQVFTVE